MKYRNREADNPDQEYWAFDPLPDATVTELKGQLRVFRYARWDIPRHKDRAGPSIDLFVSAAGNIKVMNKGRRVFEREKR